MSAYEIYDGATLVTGAVPTPYIIGTSANTAIPGSWPALITLPTPLPVPTKRLVVSCTVACNLRIQSFELLTGQSAGTYPAGLPAILPLLAGVVYTIDLPACIIWHQSLVAGALTLHAYA